MATEIEPNSQAIEVSDQETPDVQPSATDPGIEAVMERLSEQLDKRFAGFQSSIDRKISPLASELAQLRSATLTPEERDEQDKANEVKDIENLRMENQLLRLRTDHPDAVDLIIGAMGTQTLEEQISFIESKLGKKVVAQVQEAVDEAVAEAEGAGEIDPNNPGRKPQMGAASAAFATIDNDEAADAILNAAGKGALSKLRNLGR